MFPVERPFSGGIVFKKPQPRDYGFFDESEVRKAIEKEERRVKKVNKINFLSFLTAFIATSAAVLVLLGLLIPSTALARPMVRFIVGMISSFTGFFLGTTGWLVARAFIGRALPPSSEYGKAKQYIDANLMWKRRLQREYGYESH